MNQLTYDVKHTNYTQIFLEIQLLLAEANQLSDDALTREAMHTNMFTKDKNIDKLLCKYTSIGKLDKKDREVFSWFYVITEMGICIKV